MSNYIQMDSRMKDAWQLFIQKGILKREIIPDRIVYSWVRCRLKNLDPESHAIKISLRQDVKNIQRSRRAEILAIQEIIHHIFPAKTFFFITLDHFVLYSSDTFDDWIFEGIEYSEEFHGTNALDFSIESKEIERLIGHEHYKTKLHQCASLCIPMLIRGLYLNMIIPLSHYEDVCNLLPELDSKLQDLDRLAELDLVVESKSDLLPLEPVIIEQPLTNVISNHPFLCIYQFINHQLIPIAKDSVHSFFELEKSKPFLQKVEYVIQNHSKTCLYLFEDEILVVLCETIEENHYIGVSRASGLLLAANQWVGHKALYTMDDMRGDSDAIQLTIFNAKKAASHQAPILIIGESGTGKSALAQAIHNASSRFNGPFIAIDCESTPLRALESILFGSFEENSFGAIELTKSGTLYIDHIETLPGPLQKRLLKSMDSEGEARNSSSRFIFSSRHDLKFYLQQGIIREDLYHRLNIFTLSLPPLRERKGDIKALAFWLIKELSQLYNIQEPLIDEGFITALCTFPWYGNARELQQVLQDLLIQNRHLAIIKESHLIEKMKQQITIQQMQNFNLELIEKDTILAAIEKCQSNLTKAAELLGIGRTTLYRKVEKYKLNL